MRTALVSSALLSLAQALPADPPTAKACPAPRPPPQATFASYAALGDSYAAGLGSVDRLAICSPGQSPASASCNFGSCGKDVGAYGYLFATKYAIPTEGFSFFACSGANASTVAADQVASPDFDDPDLVTVQAGGDDFSAFSKIITACVFFVNDAMCRSAIATADGELGQIQQNVEATLGAVNARVKSTAVKVLVGYLQFFSPSYDSSCSIISSPIPGDLQQEVNDVVVKANQLLSETAANNGFRFVTADDAYTGHRWCDPEPWWIISNITKSGTDTGGQPYTELVLGHPSAQGQQAYLAALEGVLGLSS